MADLMESDPADALRELLAQRERAKKAVYAAAIAREKAEEELAHKEKLFQMQIEEGQKLALENAGLRRAKEELDARVKLVEDAAAVQAFKIAKKDEQLERYMKLVTRIEEAIYEEELSPQEQKIVEKAEEWALPLLQETSEDPHEGPHGPVEIPVSIEHAPVARIEAVIKKPLVLVTIISLPFLLMTFFNVLMFAGIKVQFVADLIAPYWQSWMGESGLQLVVALIPVVLYSLLFLSQRRTSRTNGVSPLEEVLKTDVEKIALESPAADADDAEEDAYLKQIDAMFGADEDDHGTKQSQ